jgi:phosphoribosyl 1,2-cyclic phosphodiesterase/CheY-like chemotaxis protein
MEGKGCLPRSQQQSYEPAGRIIVMEKIVLIDPDPEVRQVGQSALEYAGYEVHTAIDGKTGMQLIQQHKPEVVVLDLMSPGKHGYTLCQEIRSDPTLKHTRIIVCSVKAYPSDIKKAKELGADAYLIKPYRADEILNEVSSALNQSGPEVTVKFWGTRGSIPTPGPATIRYGGNTACVEVRAGNDMLMLDCGTGAREMGIALSRETKGRPLDLHVFISHTHWDHIQGFPFFVPAYSAGNRLTLYSSRGADKSLEKVFTGQMDASYFPVALTDMMARLYFVELDGPVKIGAMNISHCYLNHPGMAVGFRIQIGPTTIVYLTDHECYCRMSGVNELNRKLDREVTDFARGADLYIREAQYTDEEYATKRGWGHSTFTDALESAHEAGVKQLALFHHEPMHDDNTMDRILADCHEFMRQRGMTFTCFVAADNQQIKI